MQKENIKIHIFAFSSFGEGLSGGDNIFIELARRWAGYGRSVVVHLFEDGYKICQRASLKNVEYRICKRGSKVTFLPFFFLIRTISGLIEALRLCREEYNKGDNMLIYSASDFWPDSIPAFVFSRICRNIKWVAGFFMFAPNPFKEGFPYRGPNAIRGMLYYFSQLSIILLVNRFADFIFVTSEPDVNKFINKKRYTNRVIVVKGGIDLDFINSIPEPSKKEFDAVFMGRLHPQKGIFELLDIWRLVIKKKRQARLALIGDGYLKEALVYKLRQMDLAHNVILFGYKFGKEKIEIFKSSKVVLHPAIYDSGGMSSCEAMACGLPGVSFDLEALKTYYPRGMIKVPLNDFEGFSKEIIHLLDDYEYYGKISSEARDLALREWDWNARSRVIYDQIMEDAKYI